MPDTLDFSKSRWLNPPQQFQIEKDQVTVVTDPLTDFWQRTYYGFRHDNAQALLLPVEEQAFTFQVKAGFIPQKLFDQCGIVLYQDSDNWFKASIEYDNPSYSRLGSVVTNLGYSDWATTDVEFPQSFMVYRLSRRGQDFLVENSFDGQKFQQMRIFHLHQELKAVQIGIYACSPLNSSIRAVFTDFSLVDCLWEPYTNPDE